MHYLIDLDKFTIVNAYTDLSILDELGQVSGLNYDVVSSSKDLEDRYTSKELLALCNTVKGGNRKSIFSSKAAAVDVIWPHIEALDTTLLQTTFDARCRVVTGDIKKKKVPKKTRTEIVGKSTTEKVTVKKVPTKEASNKKTISKLFRECIKDGMEKDTTLEKVRSEFPEKSVPSSYYAWYHRDMVKKGEI